MKLASLVDAGVVFARWGRAGKIGPRWNKKQPIVIRLQRAGGKISLLYLEHINHESINWAEYAEADFDPNHNVFLVEDYYLEIEGLEA